MNTWSIFKCNTWNNMHFFSAICSCYQIIHWMYFHKVILAKRRAPLKYNCIPSELMPIVALYMLGLSPFSSILHQIVCTLPQQSTNAIRLDIGCTGRELFKLKQGYPESTCIFFFKFLFFFQICALVPILQW